jgi:hypothetical protein
VSSAAIAGIVVMLTAYPAGWAFGKWLNHLDARKADKEAGE